MTNDQRQKEPSSVSGAGGAVVKVCLKCKSAFRTRRDTCPKDGHPLATSELAHGEILAGKYRIQDEIGRGGMGVVYRAEHIIMGKAVAIKIIHPLLSLSSKFLDMFKAEARHAATFRHDNVLTVHDFGESDGRFFLVMEILEGENLKDLLERTKSVVPQRAFEMLCDICSALSAAHQAGIVHLDLKSENIYLVPEGDAQRVKVLDFGLAQLKEDASSEIADGMTIGTVGFMAPEQIKGTVVDERTDVYAIGVMAYQMLTGSLPFPGDSKEDILQAQLQGKVLKFPKTPVLTTVPSETKKVILSALSVNPARRPQSVAEISAAFQHALSYIRKAAGRYARRHKLGGHDVGANAPSLLGRLSAGLTRVLHPLGKTAGTASNPAGAPPGMVYVPAGEFMRGSNRGPADERPALPVNLDAFFIDVTPVTNLDYAKFVQATDHAPPATWKTVSFSPGAANLPVTGVTWQDAVDYAEWAGKRLPTESEWEKAARGTDARHFPWSNHWEPTFANWGANPNLHGAASISPVGSFPRDRSPYGCLDMAGNVKQWTASWYKPYGPTDFKSNDFGEKFRVVRGGSYLSKDKAYLRTSNRSHARPDQAGDTGFRCAVDAK